MRARFFLPAPASLAHTSPAAAPAPRYPPAVPASTTQCTPWSPRSREAAAYLLLPEWPRTLLWRPPPDRMSPCLPESLDGWDRAMILPRPPTHANLPGCGCRRPSSPALVSGATERRSVRRILRRLGPIFPQDGANFVLLQVGNRVAIHPHHRCEAAASQAPHWLDGELQVGAGAVGGCACLGAHAFQNHIRAAHVTRRPQANLQNVLAARHQTEAPVERRHLAHVGERDLQLSRGSA